MKKVTVTVPENRISETKDVARTMREEHRQVNASASKAPGWDAKIISQIAKDHFGGFEKMFIEMGWPERGSDMMRKVQSHVKQKFGSVERFHAAYFD